MGASWQRCRVHFVRNALALVPKSAAQLVAATIRTVFAQPEPEMARAALAAGRRRLPPALSQAGRAPGRRPRSMCWPISPSRPSTGARSGATIPWSGSNREVKRRTDVVGIFPNEAAIVRLVGMILAEQHDEWQVGRRYFSAESLAKLASAAPTTVEAASR